MQRFSKCEKITSSSSCEAYEYDFAYECKRLVEAMAPRPARSFRQEFNMHDLATSEQTVTTTHYSHSQFSHIKTTHKSDADGHSPTRTNVRITGQENTTNGKSPYKTSSTFPDETDRPDLRNLKRVHKMYEGPNIIESKGIVHPLTREILTVGQAISMRILDVRSGRLLSSPETRQTMTIEQAAKEGLIEPKLAARLVGPCGTTEDGNEVTLLEAIQRELYDAEQGITDPQEKRIKVTAEQRQIDGEGMSISDALNRGQVDLQRGLYRLPDGTYISISEAYQRGYLIYNEIIKIKSNTLTLSDAVGQRLVDGAGWILDRNSGDKFQLDVAIKNGLIDPEIREIVDPKADTKVTLRYAIENKLVNPKLGKYTNNITNDKLSFKEAANRRLIGKPMTLKDVYENNLMDNEGKIASPMNRRNLNILEAISYGVLDSDTVKSVTDTTSGQLLTLSEALGSRIILPDSKYRDNLTNEICSIPEAVERGLITSVSQKSIFDIDGFRDPISADFVSFNTAVSRGIICNKNAGVLLRIDSAGNFVTLEEGVQNAAVRLEVLEMLNRNVGIFENGQELTVLETVFRGVLDPKSGYLLEPSSRQPIPFNKAVEINLITPEGAALLNSLLNITLTVQTVTKTVKRYVTITNTNVTQRSETIITFAEAVRRGLIDECTQTFTDPNSGTIIPIQQALDEGLIGIDQNGPKVVQLADQHLTKRELVPEQIVELKITKKSYNKDIPLTAENKIRTDSQPETIKSPEHKVVHSRTAPSPQKVQIVEKMITDVIRQESPKTVTTETFTTQRVGSSVERRSVELPSNGWTLAEAIRQKFFDPITGLFIIPGTDRLVSFEECIQLDIINHNSAVVVDSKNNREISIKRALEKQILNNTGHYLLGKKYIPMKEAIERNLIIIDRPKIEHSPKQKVIEITRVTGKPDKVEISDISPTGVKRVTELESADAEQGLEPVQVAPGIIFDPSTALVISTKTGRAENMLEAIQEGIIQSESVTVVEPRTGHLISISEALQKGIVNPKTGDYRDNTGRKISLADAAKFGVIAVIGAPLIAAAKAIKVIRNTMVIDPKTGENIPMEVAFERGLVDNDTYRKYQATSASISPVTESYTVQTSEQPSLLHAIHINVPNVEEAVPLKIALEQNIVSPQEVEDILMFTETTKSPMVAQATFIDPKTGKHIPLSAAISQEMISSESMSVLSRDMKEQHNALSSIASLAHKDHLKRLDGSTIDRPSEAELTRARITIDPKYTVTIGTATVDGGVINEAKPVILQKLRKKVISPSDAVEKGMIDEQTAQILGDVNTFIDPKGKVISLAKAIENKKINPAQGSIVDPQRGDVLTIQQAIERGVLDPDGTNELLIPLAKSLSVPELIKQGLLEPRTGKIVHPETGGLLTLREAIVCDIVDPLSMVDVSQGHQVTLGQAIEQGLIDDESNTLLTQVGEIPLLNAVQQNVFIETPTLSTIEAIPPAAMTLPVLIERNLVKCESQQIIHPLTGEAIPMEQALKSDLIMSIPFQVADNAIGIKEALDKNIIDSEKGTFVDPNTQEKIKIETAIEQGLLVIKSDPNLVNTVATSAVTTVTETVTSHHTITTKMIELLSGYVLLSATEVKNTSTGEILSIEDAREQGIVKDEKISKEHFTTKEVKLTFEDALQKGLVDLHAGTYTDPQSGKVMQISEAISDGILDTSTERSTLKTVEKEELEKFTLITAYEQLFDEKTQMFKDPKNANKSLTFEQALQKNVIDGKSVIYDVQSKQSLTLEEGIKEGLIDKTSGKIKNKKSGSSIDVKKAAKMGLLAVVAAPVMAGMAVVSATKSLADKVSSKFEEPSKAKSVQAELVKPVKAEDPKPIKAEIARLVKGQETKPENEKMLKPAKSKEGINAQQIVTERKQIESEPEVEEPSEDQPQINSQSEVTIEEISSTVIESVSATEETSVIEEKTPLKVETVIKEGPMHATSEIIVLSTLDTKTSSELFIEAESRTERSKSIDEIVETDSIISDSDNFDVVYDRMPLGDAISQNKVKPKVCRIIINGQESPLTVQDALDQEQLSVFTIVDVVSTSCISIVEERLKYSIKISDCPTPEQLAEIGVYDINKQTFLNPETGAKITFQDLVYALQVFDPETILVKDLSAKSDEFIPFNEAIARPIIDRNTGHMVNPKTGKRVSLFECIKLGWIVEEPEDLSVNEPLTLETALESGLFDPQTGEVKNLVTGELEPIGEALIKGIIDEESLQLRVPQTNEIIPLMEAVSRGFVDLQRGTVTCMETKQEITLSVAILEGQIISTRVPISIEAVVKNKEYEPESGKIRDSLTRQLVTIDEAVERNIVHASISEVKDTKADNFVTLEEALTTKLINSETGKLRDTKGGKLVTLDVALSKGFLATKTVTWALREAIELGYYSPQTCKIVNPKTGDEITLNEAISSELVNVESVRVKDDQTETVLPFHRAIETGLIDTERGVLTHPPLNLQEANEKGYLLSDVKPWSLQESLVQGFYDSESGLLTIKGVTTTLDDAIKSGDINPNILTVKNSKTNDIITLTDAIRTGIIDSKEGKAMDPLQGDKITLTDASERGLILPAKRKLSLPEAVFKGFYDPKSGKFLNPQNREKIPTDKALKKRLLDPQSTLVQLGGKVIPFEFAVDNGIVDSRTGTIVLGDEKIDFREAFERGILIEVRKPMSLTEAILKGVYDEVTGLFLDPKTGKKYNLADAIKLNLIDPHSVHVKDVRLGKWNKISLTESLQMGVVNSKSGKIKNINNDNEEIGLKEAFEIGLLVDSKAPISLQRALHQGLYDENSGKIIDSVTNRKITLHEALRKSLISTRYLCYFDKKSGKPLTLAECCRNEIVDKRNGQFKEPGSDTLIPLSEAMSLGLIVDIESAGFSLYEALSMSLYDGEECKFIHPVTDRKLSLKASISEELINPEISLVKNIPMSKYVKIGEAIELGIVNQENSLYILPNGSQINLNEAKLRGLIVTSRKGLSIEEIIKNGLFRPDTGKLVDPNTGEFSDLNEAIDTGLINPELTAVKDTVTSKYKPLLIAIENGDVNVNKGRVLDTKSKKAYSLDIALDKGLIVTVIQPITSHKVVKKYAAELSRERESMFREFTLDEAIRYEYIDAETAVMKDPHKEKYITLKLAITEGIISRDNKGTFDLQSGRSKALCFLFENGLIVYVREPLTFEQAVELGHLNVNTAKFTDPHSDQVLTLKDAVVLGHIDPDTALIKDNLKKRLVKLPDAFRKGLIDAEKGNILDTQTSKLNTLPAALESGLLITPKKSFSLIETIKFGIYNPTTGGLNDPFITTSVIDRKRLTLAEAIERGIVDPSSTVIKGPETGKICPLVQAIDEKLVDPIAGRIVVDTLKEVTLDLVKAQAKGYILAAETRQAVEEKYRLCDETLSKLLEWIAEVEDRLANQEAAKEDIDELRNQINTLKQIKDDIDGHQRQVSACADQAKQLLLSGGDVLAPHEVAALERGVRQLKQRAEKCGDRADKMLRRLAAARDELTKFSTELTTFNSWMEGAYRTLEDHERALSDLSRPGQADEARDFLSDVIAHQADLRFITMAAQKFLDEGKEFLSQLNEYRTSLPSRLSHVSAPHVSPVREQAGLARRRHGELVSRAQRLHERVRGAADVSKLYHDALDRAGRWIKEVEPQVRSVVSEAVGGDARAVESQLARAKGLQNEIMAQGRLIHNAKDACDQLVKSLEGNLTPAEIRNLEVPVLDLTRRYEDLSSAVAGRCAALEEALVQCQGLQDAAETQAAWLAQAESAFKSQYKPVSLIRARLEEQQREHRASAAELDAHRPSLQTLAAGAKKLEGADVRRANKLQQKVDELLNKYEKLCDKCIKRGELLEEVSSELAVFTAQAEQLEQHNQAVLEQTESRDLQRLPADELQHRLAQIAQFRDSKKQLLEECLRNGKQLIAKKDVTDTHVVRDRMKGLEQTWRDLAAALDDKHKLSRQRAEQLGQYEALRAQVVEWLSVMESRVNHLRPVAVDLEVIKYQQDELRPLLKDYKDYSHTIDKVNEVGSTYDALVRGERADSPTHRKKTQAAYSPTKRQTPLRGLDGRSPSPTKGAGLVSPASTHSTSSGFSSRRSSQDGFHLEDLSPVQQQLSEINNRYSLLGTKLSDRHAELEAVREEMKRHLESLKALSAFLDKIQRQLPKDSVPSTKEEADKTIKQARAVLEEMYEKQSALDSTKTQVRELLKRKQNVEGADRLHDEMEEVASRWKTLHDACKDKIRLMEDIKDFHDTHGNLSQWLTAKDRMMAALGPISSDSRTVQTQVQQVQVLREEFRGQQPQLTHLENVGAEVLKRLDTRAPDAIALQRKLDDVRDRWNELLDKLEKRAESLGAAADTSREFDAGLTRLRDALQSISDNLDDLPLDKEPEEQLRKVENLERQLEGQRPLLADLESAGAALCDVLSDPASRQDIQSKLASVERQYNNLQRKLDHKKAEIEGSLRDGRNLEESVARTVGWLQNTMGSLSGRLLVSAHKDKLQQQLEAHEPLYRDVMAREHEVIMLLNKGREMDSRSLQPSVRKELERVQQQWDKLRREAVDRHTRLQTAMEHCRKYYRAQEQFLPWLAQAEQRLAALPAVAFTKKELDKRLRELQQIRNDVWKRSGEYENNKTLGETFVSACDVDQEVVKDQLADMKERWDKLNNDVLNQIESAETLGRELGDFAGRVRGVEGPLERCEERLEELLRSPPQADAKLAEAVARIEEDAHALKAPLQSIITAADDIVSLAGDCGGSETAAAARRVLEDQTGMLGHRLKDLQTKAKDAKDRLLGASKALTHFNDQVKGLSNNLSDLERQLDAMKPPGRDIKTVKGQLEGVARFQQELDRAERQIEDAERAGDALVDSGYAPDTAQTRQQMEGLKRQLGGLDERARAKEQQLQDTLAELEDFYKIYDAVMDDIEDATEQVRALKPVGSEVEQIRAQQRDFAALKKATLEPLGSNVGQCNKIGQALVRGAQQGVNTQELEKALEKMNDRWNALKEKTNERERRLDVGLLQSGKFQEALDGLAKWLSDTEEMVANQKPASADYKVVKAQLQEQKFLKKMLLDRQASMSSLFAMGNEVAAGCEPQERKAIEKQLKGLMGRFDALTGKAQDRMLQLEQAMKVAKQFEEQLQPLLEWLGTTERKVKVLELVPTDEEKIQQRIREHKGIHDDILSKRPAFTQLTDTASALMALVGDDEASSLADKLQAATDRYAALVDHSLSAGELLERSRQGLRHLVLTYQELTGWMDAMDQRLARKQLLPVHTDKLLRHMDDLADLTEEIASRQEAVDSTVESGLELMKHISGDEALQLKDKLDALQRRYNDLTSKGADLLRRASEALPLVQQFHNSHTKLTDWMTSAEGTLQSAEPQEDDILRLEADLQEFRPVLDSINLIGPQLCQISPGEGASLIEGLVTRDNRRFDAIVEQVQRKAERLLLSKKRSLEVLGDMEELLDWFRVVESALREAEPPCAEPDLVRAQLKQHRPLNEDVSAQRARVRDAISTAKKVLRESQPSDDTSAIRDKMEELRETMETVGQLSSARLAALEQALPLAEHLADTHRGLAAWLTDAERQVAMLAMPAVRPEHIAQQQDKNEQLLQAIAEQKPIVDKLVKTGEALARLVGDEDALKIQELVEGDCERYAALRADLRARQQDLERALQESSLFSDKLEGMLRALANTADQVHNAEPVSAHPPKIQDQIEDNNALVDDLDKRSEAYAAVQRAARDVINKAPNKADPAVRDIKNKLDKLKNLWDEVQKATNDRTRSLDSALEVAKRFWEALNAVMATLAELEDTLSGQAPPAAQPRAIQAQQVALQEIRQEIDQTKPEVEKVRKTGTTLMNLCGEPDKPEVKKHMEDLESAWDNVTALYARREENLIDAMEKAMEFHETLQNLLEFLDKAEDKFSRMGPLGSDIDAVKRQIGQLNNFKQEVDPHMVKVEALNRQAQELTERTSSEQAAAIRKPLSEVNTRWGALLRGMVERQRQLEHALLRLGQFQHALDELLVWINKTDATLDTLKPVAGDPQILEVELAKLKVLVNDIQAHQTSVDTLNDAGTQIIQQGKGTDEASATQDKLQTLNKSWRELQQKANDRQTELEDALREAQRFNAEIHDLLSWLSDVDSIIAASKPVGGLPETATEQLERFMEVYNEMEENRPKVEAVLQQGQEYVRKQERPASSGLQHNLKMLKQRWDSVTARASDKKIKLEIALKEATEFHDALQAFVDWLTNAEKTLSSAKPVSRVMDTVLSQIEEHKSFQKEVSTHRETMLQLDKKGTHLKYFSQKQDVILIKNLLVSVQHRWERVVSRAAERTRALDHGFKEAKDFHDQWTNLMNWLENTEQSLDELNAESTVNDPEKIKQRLSKHREFQKALAAKQPAYDATSKCGKQLKDKAPKADEPALRQMLSDLKAKWSGVCSKAVDRQRKLEEALLYSGQFKDAMGALLDWLKKQEAALAADSPVHGDLDTVMALVEQHKQFEEDLQSRSGQMKSVLKTGAELEATVPREDAAAIRAQGDQLRKVWDNVQGLSEKKAKRLEGALKEAEKLHKQVHMLLEWLSDAESRLRFAGALPEGEIEAATQLAEHERFVRELREQAKSKDDTLALARAILAKAHPDAVSVIKHWITIIQSRWDEVSQWALQRGNKLEAHMQGLKDLDLVLEELLQWLSGLENTLLSLEAEPLPESIEILEGLIQDHKELMEHTQKRQVEVDRVCKAYQLKSTSTSHTRESTPRKVPGKTGVKGPAGKGAEPEFRSPRVRSLWDKWRSVWLLAWERQRRLAERLAHLQELQRVQNFSWDDWRKRFLKFMNHKKSRLTDLFRKMDKDNNGLIPRNEFIDGIINTKFDTSRLEMGAVADLFDRNNMGLIDWEEFIAALRPDWVERRGPPNDADKIHDEVKRLVMLCTCRQKFRVFQVGEGKYRFGDSQKLRLVRILRSTVMVRVGGGWVALDEFLVKNDPCRAKGRTNIELREQFILADGVSQSMAAFRPRTPARSSNTPPSAGPITKVRERSNRSVPMSGSGSAGRASRSAGTPDSLSDNEAAGASRGYTPQRKPSLGRSTVTPGGSRPSSRPGSRAGSKPPSRHGSNLSLDSTDDATPSRIPMRRVTTNTTRSGTTTPRPTKLGTTNGSTTTSRPRTPTGILTPAQQRYPGSSMYRTSSIPTLSATPALVSSTHSLASSSASEDKASLTHSSHRHPALATSTKIPVYVGFVGVGSRKERSVSLEPCPIQSGGHSAQRTPEEDSSLCNISGISTTSDNDESCGSDVSAGCREGDGRSGSFVSESPRSRIPVLRDPPTPLTATNHNVYRQRTPSGSSTPVTPGQAAAAARILARKGSNASESGAAARKAANSIEKREPFRL